MPVQLGDTPLADFNRPLDLMMDCHRRIERFLEVLIQIVRTGGGRPLDDEHRGALVTALNYFHAAAPHHTQDEERSLFPRLRCLHGSAVREALAPIEALERDHVAAERAHERADTLGRQWLTEGRLPRKAVDELLETLIRLRADYENHIRIEDENIFPLAAKLLDDDELARIGREMKYRRRVAPGRKDSRCARRRESMMD